jgi:LysR family transcriptional regulator, hydrogen peroxide-inducible genes activator
MISLKQLHYALAVEQTRHFKKAADLCFISQSALSTSIAELEKQLGVQLFERDNKKVLLTPIGEQFLEKARDIKIQIDDLTRLVDSYKAPLSYPMTIGVIPTIGPYLLPKVLPAVRKVYPDFQLRIIEDQSKVLLEKLRDGEIDAAILALPYPIEALHSFVFLEEDFFWVAHQSDANAKQKEITSKEIRHRDLMLLEEGHCLKDHALAACKFKTHESDNSFASASLHTLVQMVAGKMGTTLVPEMALDQLLAGSSELKAVHLNEPGPHRKIAFVSRLNYAGVSNIEVLMTLFKKQLKPYEKRKSKK